MRVAACVAAAALAGAAVFAVLLAGPDAFAGGSRGQSPAASASPSPSAPVVKFYVVPKSGTGPQTLSAIAAKTLGSASKFRVLFDLNRGRVQPDGGRLENASVISAGWIIQLPPNASGPLVRIGPVRGARVSSHASASPTPSAPAAGRAAASQSASHAGVIGAALLVLAIAGLAFVIAQVRRGKRKPARTRAAKLRTRDRPAAARSNGRGTAPWRLADDRDEEWPPADHPSWPAGQQHAPDYPSWPAGQQHAADHPSWPAGEQHAADYPSWPAGEQHAPDYPSWPSGQQHAADHPSWPAADWPAADWPGGDHPSWPAGDDQEWLGGDHPSWPATDLPAAERPSWVGADHPSWPAADEPDWPQPLRGPGGQAEPAPPVHHDQRRRESPAEPLPHGRGQGGDWGPPAGPGGAQRPPGQPMQAAGPVGYVRPEPGSGPGQGNVMLTDPLAGADLGTGAQEMLRLARDRAPDLVDPVRREVEQLWNADSLRLAERILSEADEQAATMLATAEQDAAQLRQEAAEIKRQASDHAAATISAAEQEAADLRAAIQKMSDELGGVAAYVTENLATPLKPASKPEFLPRQHATEALIAPVKPVPGPGTAKPAAPSDAETVADLIAPPKPATRPARPATKPQTRPAVKPKSRQLGVMRKMMTALAVVVLIGMLTSAAEIWLHGFSFFLFRNTGAGAGNSQNLEENQGPGQPDAGKHHKAAAAKTEPAGKHHKTAAKSKQGKRH